MKNISDPTEARKRREEIVLQIFANDFAIFQTFGETPEANMLRDLLEPDDQFLESLDCGPPRRSFIFDSLKIAGRLSKPTPIPSSPRFDFLERIRIYHEAISKNPERPNYCVGREFIVLCKGDDVLDVADIVGSGVYFGELVSGAMKMLRRYRIVMD